MPAEFIKCTECSMYFAKDETGCEQCHKCRGESYVPQGSKDTLRYLRSMLRDAGASGEMLTIPQLAERAQVSDTVIWEFIKSGQLDVATFSDPEVRNFVVKRHRERLKEVATRIPEPVSSESKPKRSGFHKRVDD